MDISELAKTFGGALVGGLTGVVGAYLKASNRVTNLETWKAEYLKTVEEEKKRAEAQFDQYKSWVKEQFENLGKAWKLALDMRDDNIKEKIKELKDQLKELDDSFEKFQRASHHDFARDEEFNRFVEEMNKQWKAVQRTLGQIEGWMKAQPKGPSTFPPM